MKISLIKKEKIEDFVLPPQVHGNYWITDETKDGKIVNFINIVEDNKTWRMMSNFEVSVYENDVYMESVVLGSNKFYTLKSEKEEDILLLCQDAYENNTYQLMLKSDAEIMIGSKETCQICFNNKYVDSEHAKLIYKNGEWAISKVSVKSNVYVNNKSISSKRLNNGDVIFIAGLKTVVIKNNIVIKKIDNIKVDSNLFTYVKFPKQNIREFKETDEEISYYKDSDYFFKAPRFRSSSDKLTLTIDPAPQKEREDKTPIIYIIGPMLTMGITSMVTAFTAINNVVSNGKSMKEALPSIMIAGAMLATIVIWPLLIKKFQKKQRKENEKARREKYTAYIESRRNLVKKLMAEQTTALVENYPPLEEIKKMIMFRKTNLWEREIDQDDFLKLRVGTGTEPLNIDIKYPEEHFSMEEDDLRSILNNLVSDSKELENVPVTISFAEKYISSIVGETPAIEKVAYGLILQLIAYHSYDDLKLVFFTNQKKKEFWEFAKSLPHCWSDDKLVRYFATNPDEMNQISSFLEEDFQARKYRDSDPTSERKLDYTFHKPYYFIIVDNLKEAREIEIIKDVLEQKINVGFSILILNDKLTNLPNECMNFICIGHNNRSVIFEGELVTNKQRKFIVDIDNNLDLTEYAIKLANIPIDTVKDEANFPKSISFLEMYDVGKVEQLNSFNRWQVNTPVNSLQAPLGIDKHGNLFKLDLHEKFHGPHGLIAGMTGSGKSELIITYILSLAVNYHPNEVSFIIIDYKGGGVAGAFENKDTGIKLPHIAGTITNLDTVELNRSLVSIQSELKRRQKAFNKARDNLGESTVDIYKYQKLYKSGLVDEPISHLFIICDEFAELKVQQPDFMEQLISTARIGRSLGVHLILATQKPSGVVDNQIWSNSRFRICLKVQEKEDSMDMIKCPDAAMLKSVGRFYLQVGYNEFFAEGLSAWCGAQYIPTDKLKKKVDNSLNFIDNTGYIIKSVDDEIKSIGTSNQGEQLTNIIKYLIGVAKESKIDVKQLWLDRIPDLIYVDELKKKYYYEPEPYIINPIIGEYDDPSNQRQDLLTLNLTSGGNAIIYGTSGSGKSVLLSSIIYSSIINHTPNEVNFYIMDFGSEMFKIFSHAPHVGDILLINDNEKVVNLFKMLKTVINERKQLFIEYNGDFKYYNKKSQNKLPLIVVILNNYEAFSENYEKYEDTLLQLTREGEKYGITFVITVNGVNSIRYRIKQNFKQEFVLQMNDETDYISILGNTNKVYPSKATGRGLYKKDKVYEFQSSYPYEPNQMSEYIGIICNRLRTNAKDFADSVAILPEIVTTEHINSRLRGLDMVPVGVDKNTLSIATWDFNNNYSTIITGLEFSNMNYFIKPLISQFGEISNCTTLVLDSLGEVNNLESAPNTFYYDKDFDKVIDSLYANVEKQYAVYEKNQYSKAVLTNIKPAVCIIVGIDSLLLKLKTETKEKYNSLVEKGNAIDTIRLIFIDTIDIFKKLEYNDWYRAIIKNSQGIWLGNGISNQYSLKIAKVTREIQEDIPLGFGYIVKRGIPTLTKFLTSSSGYRGENDE